jgi:hypothetical protein
VKWGLPPNGGSHLTIHKDGCRLDIAIKLEENG